MTENISPSLVLTAELWIRGSGTATSPTDPLTQRRLINVSFSKAPAVSLSGCMSPAPFSRTLDWVLFNGYSS